MQPPTRMLLMQPKSMQQIAILIITFSAYVVGIRNSGAGTGDGGTRTGQHNYESRMVPYVLAAMDMNYLPESLNGARQSNGFRPSQIIDFTPSDATVAQNYRPTYAQSTDDYQTTEAMSAPAEVRYNMEKLFRFPNEPQQQTSPAASHTYNNYNNRNYNNNKGGYTEALQLHTAPIFTYRDPYTNQNYQYTPSIETGNQGAQEYTVHSSMLVGGAAQMPEIGYRPQEQQHLNGMAYQRPLYAGEEAARPVLYVNKYPAYQQQTRFPQRKPTPSAAPPERLSYDSHDYPPPSYLQQQQQQQSTHFQSMSPQRQDTTNYVPPLALTHQHTTPSNYANNFGNYLQGGQQNFQSNYDRPPQPSPPQVYYGGHKQQGPPRPPNYFAYQQGEVPPQGNYRPPYRPPAAAPPPSSGGLASLASLFTTTQQYAPQFTNLLLGGIGLGGNGGNGGSLASRPMNMQLIKALENIARNDDLQCVPKVLCQMIAGQTQRGQLPSFITSPAITNFLAGFPAASPALIYGRAALLGISGGESSCTQSYAQCPKNEYEILYYLNNHRGGFFKFFSEPEEQTTTRPSYASINDNSVGGDSGGGGGGGSLLSILSALAGNPVATPQPTTTPRPRPSPRPTMASTDITGSIGNFFTQVLSDYLGGVEYQRRRRRRAVWQPNYGSEEIAGDDISRKIMMNSQKGESEILEDFQDEEDEEDTQQGVEKVEQDNNTDAHYEDAKARILHKGLTALDEPKFFPSFAEHSERPSDELAKVIKNFNNNKSERKLKFPKDDDGDEEYIVKPHGYRNEAPTENSEIVFFKDDADEAESEHVRFSSKDSRYGRKVVFKTNEEKPADTTRLIIFPDHYDTHIRKGRILNRPEANYATTYTDYVRSSDERERLVVSEDQRRRPHYQNYRAEDASSNQDSHSHKQYGQTHTAHVRYEQQSKPTNQNRFGFSNSNDGSYNTHDSHNSYNYPNNNYVSSNRYGSTTRSPPTPREDDRNVYVTNSKGVTEYYITPGGRKVLI